MLQANKVIDVDVYGYK